MNKLPNGALGYCASHNIYWGSVTQTIPSTRCPLCGIAEELRAQSAPRTYEVARALSWVDAVEASAPLEPGAAQGKKRVEIGRIYWLIERFDVGYDDPNKRWLAVYDAPESYSKGFFWTDQSNVAMQFSRKEDADKQIAVLNLVVSKHDTRTEPLKYLYQSRATEHMDCYGPKATHEQ